MLKVWAVNINDFINKETQTRLWTFLSTDRQQRIMNFIDEQDAKRSMTAELLLQSIIAYDLKKPNTSVNFSFNEYGKPFLPSIPDFYFNLSHSGNWVICATDNQPVGIDVEELDYIEPELVSFILSPDELQMLNFIPEYEKRGYFYERWVLKESCTKALGIGLSLPFEKIILQKKKGPVYRAEVDDAQDSLWLKLLELDVDYKLAVCAYHIDLPNYVNIVDFEWILRHLRL